MTGRRYLGLLAVLALMGVIAATIWALQPPGRLVANVGPSARPAAGDLPWLSVAGGRIVDEQGRAVVLHGFNDDALLHYPWRNPPGLDDADAALMQRAGFDVVRIPISWDEIEPRRGQIDEGYVERIAAAVALLGRHHLYSILDMHFLPGWGEAFYAGTAPDWAVLPGIPNVDWARVDPFDKDTNPSEMASETYFWVSPDWQADFVLAWRAVARRLAGESDLAGYDIYNEAHPFPVPPRIFEQRLMWPLFARAISGIAAVDSNHLFLVESTLFGDESTAIVPLRARGLVYAPHLYTGALVPGILSPGAHPIADAISGRRHEAAMLPAALWFGELGIQQTRDDAMRWADEALQQLDVAGAGWAWWQWRQDDGWGIRSQAGGQLNIAFLRHLARPYLEAAPAGVSARGADGVLGALDISVAPRTSSVEMVVAWSGLTLRPPVISSTCAVTSSYTAADGALMVGLPPGGSCEVHLRAGRV